MGIYSVYVLGIFVQCLQKKANNGRKIKEGKERKQLNEELLHTSKSPAQEVGIGSDSLYNETIEEVSEIDLKRNGNSFGYPEPA